MWNFIGILRLAAALSLFFSFLHNANSGKCFQDTCAKTFDDKLNVHLIAHTHDDVGWLKTVDQYYYGSNKGHAPFGVQYILDSVVSELQKNPNRKFVYVEMSFFWRWWEEQDNASRAIVKNLVDKGQLEFLHGGWCMSDEATTHYTSLVDQMTLGLKFLNETFGDCGRPNVAWQIDPFGHSSEIALEFAEMGFDGMFVGRVDYEDRHARTKSKRMEMIWRPDSALGEDGQLFFGILYDTYSAPDGFCFDTYCADEPIMDNKKLHGYNVDVKVKKFLEHVETYRNVYKSNHLFMTMGGDFTYSVASSWFKNMDKLIKYVNEKSTNVHMLYSTPSCYLKAVNEAGLQWPVKDDDDFFPYGSDKHSYWTGYFTSRPTLKFLVYKANNFLQGVKQLGTCFEDEVLKEEEWLMKRSMGMAQHHDAVSGTEKQHVSDDYAVYIHEGIEASQTIFNKAYKKFYGNDFPEHHFCMLSNISQCSITEGGPSSNFVITLYNPMSLSMAFPVRVPIIHNTTCKVYQMDGSLVDADIVPVPVSVLRAPGRISNATNDLAFYTQKLPPMGAVSYFVEQIQASAPLTTDQNPTPAADNVIAIGNEKITQLIFNKNTGLLENIKKNGVSYNFRQNFYFYTGMKGYNYNADSRASGAYIFRPTKTDAKPISEFANITEYKGKKFTEVHQSFTPWLSQVIRLYHDREDVEFQWLVGPIPIPEYNGMEVVTRYSTNLVTNGTFYTDSNGRRWMKRVRNHRKTWNLTITEPVACNYYPVTTAACLRDNDRQVTIVTDRPEGASSMNDGQLEIMIHRRLLYDDNKGVTEPLDETAYGEGLVVRGTHILQLESLSAAPKPHRLEALKSAYNAIPMMARTSLTPAEWNAKYKNKQFSLMKNDISSPYLNVMSLERWRGNTLLLRLENTFESNEQLTATAANTSVDIQKLFSQFQVTHFEELTLAANRPKKALKRMKWKHDGKQISSKKTNADDGAIIHLLPMQIRTFLLTITRI